MNVSRAIIENMTNEQKALDAEIEVVTTKLAALHRQRGENAAHIMLAKSFGNVSEVSHG